MNRNKSNHNSRNTNHESHFQTYIENFNSQTIAIIGDLILDKYIYGSVDRISPEAPVPVVKVTGESYVPGGAANVGELAFCRHNDFCRNWVSSRPHPCGPVYRTKTPQ